MSDSESGGDRRWARKYLTGARDDLASADTAIRDHLRGRSEDEASPDLREALDKIQAAVFKIRFVCDWADD